ncbi:MAG TPA: integrase arm-type DNA-binding domain-containing protein [Steroidobacteraceae bacterium]|nr:integrase arm-type DNA-binding domain-containing protein [Steroidobacteraceae bacterium]
MLTEAKIRSAKPREKKYKLYDERGLYIIVTPQGGRWWRFKYRFGGKERGLCFGVHPDVLLLEARERRDQANRLLELGLDPIGEREVARAARGSTFKTVAEEWLASRAELYAPVTMSKALWILETFIYPCIGERPISVITAPELLAALKPIERQGMRETAHRAMQKCGQIFRYAVASGCAPRDITVDLRGVLAPAIVRNRAAVTEPQKIGALLRAIDGFDGHPTTGIALKLSPLLFVRPGELRAAEWSEFNLDSAEWRIPAERMKMRERHIVPLSRQAIALLRELHALTGTGKYLFPSLRDPTRSMSYNTVTFALRRLGYSGEEMTAHGFRAMASTCLNELGWAPDIIERQLAHAERNKVRAAYNRAERLADRRTMMQAWADYLDGLRGRRREVSPPDTPPPPAPAPRKETVESSRKLKETRDDAAAQLELVLSLR